MKFPFFASFIIFCAWLAYEIHKTRRKEDKQAKSFWDLESEANSVRRKPLDDLAYITIPFADLPMTVMAEDEQVAEYHDLFRSLAENPIVNFTGISNTDLKLRYGAPNIELLTRYDQNFTLLVRTLQKWADKLYESGYLDETRVILEFALSCGTDISRSFFLLADIYRNTGMPEKIGELITAAEQLNTPLQGTILRKLQQEAELPDTSTL